MTQSLSLTGEVLIPKESKIQRYRGSMGFSSSGTQDVSVARWAPSNPLGPDALCPRKLFEETLWGFHLDRHQAFVRYAHFSPLPVLSL